jgi:glycerol-3-phosphate acyltransferase PlsX
VEGRDVFRGTCDVVVTDGFTGNVVLKTAESVAELLFKRIRAEVSGDPMAMFGTMLMRPALKRLMRQLDWEEHAAAPLLGVNGVCFVGHGSSSPKAIRSAIRTVATFVEQRVNEHIREEIEADRETAA